MPTLNVAGWWDQEDFYGPVRIYDELEKHDTQAPQLSRRRALEPRRLGAAAPASRSGRFRSAATRRKYFRDQIQAPWFAHFLKDKGTLDLPEALTFEAGAQRVAALGRVAADTAHRRRARCISVRTRQLAFDKPASAGGEGDFDSYVSDPAYPGPVPAAADPADLLPRRIEVVHVAGRGSAVRGRSRRRAQLGDRRRSTPTSRSPARSSRTCSRRRPAATPTGS